MYCVYGIQVVASWRGVMDSLISRHATRLLRLRIDEIEVKVRVSSTTSDGKQQVLTYTLLYYFYCTLRSMQSIVYCTQCLHPCTSCDALRFNCLSTICSTYYVLHVVHSICLVPLLGTRSLCSM
jgi:hypothetical protein